MDYAHEWTDREIERLSKRMRREYAQAAREMRAKLNRELERYGRELEAREKALDDTQEARKAHMEWLSGQAANQEHMARLTAELAASAAAANQRAMALANDALPRVYAENISFAAYTIDKDIGMFTSFELVNEDAVRAMMGLGKDGQVLHEVIDYGPPAKMQSLTKRPDVQRDIRWNRQKFNSALTQGILQGESVPDIARRLDGIYGSNWAAAERAARTACTGAENMGRLDAMKRAERLGIRMRKKWSATLDAHTRDSHRALDGEVVAVGEPFDSYHGAIDFPGDPAADPAETYNCRCRLESKADGSRDDSEDRWAKLPKGMTYDEWKEAPAARRGQGYARGEDGKWKVVDIGPEGERAQKGTRRW